MEGFGPEMNRVPSGYDIAAAAEGDRQRAGASEEGRCGRVSAAISWESERGTGHTMNDLLKRISVNPQICGGKPCIRGTRIWVSLLLDFLASGSSMEEILAEYPQLTREDLLAAIAYGAEMSRERFVDLPGSSAA